jgi:hypothetical protein
MPFGSGSKSAQTPSESSQQSASNAGGPAVVVAAMVAGLAHATQYRVYHKWRKVGSVAKRGMPHHSQIFITTLPDVDVVNFGLFADDDGNVVFESEDNDPVNPFHTSSSYNPNPKTATGLQIIQAVNATSIKCGPKYALLQNNCQKFARLLMTALGASHSRELFHP